MKLNVSKIESEMNRLGISKADLAERMEMSRQIVYDLFGEPRKRGATIDTINRLASALNMDPKDLLI